MNAAQTKSSSKIVSINMDKDTLERAKTASQGFNLSIIVNAALQSFLGKSKNEIVKQQLLYMAQKCEAKVNEFRCK